MSIREELSAAFDAAETDGSLHGEPATPAPAPAPASEPAPAEPTAKLPEGAPNDSRSRDEGGRFAKGPKLGLPKKGAPAPEPHAYRTGWDFKLRSGETIPTFDLAKRPADWRPEMEPFYGKLPPEVRDYLHLRAWEAARGIEPLKAQANALAQWRTALGPVLQQLQSNGVPPELFLRDIAGTVMTLAQGTPEQKRGAIMRIASQYGVELAQQAAAAAGVQPATGQPTPPASNLPPELATALQEIKQFREEQAQAREAQEAQEWTTAAQAIQAMEQDVANFPHFSKVRVTMGKMIQAGLASSMPDAYKQAVRLDPELAAADDAARAAAAKAEQEKQAAAAAAAARANVVSPKGSTPGAAGSHKSAPKDRRESISSAWEETFGSGARV